MAESQLSLYLHIPFCTVKCSYCDFNSYAGLERLRRPYTEALIQELRLWREQAADYKVETVFLGGGTPSLMPLEDLECIMDAVRANFRLAGDAEVSLEANPGTIGLEYLRGLLALGVNRLSMGVQSFHDDELVALERLHNAEEARQAYSWAREAGFQRVNLDLMYGLPEQPMESWQANVEEALRLRPDHLSLYALTVEPGTPLARYTDDGRSPMPDGDLQADMYEWTQDRLDIAGYEQYEISNWALPGQRCRHNLTYWQSHPYLGLGAGGHSYFNGLRFANVRSPQQYIHSMTAVTAGAPETATLSEERLRALPHITDIEAMDEAHTLADTLILGLRLTDGIDTSVMAKRFGRAALESHLPAFTEMTDLGLLAQEGARVRLTRKGLLLANEVFVRLLPD